MRIRAAANENPRPHERDLCTVPRGQRYGEQWRGPGEFCECARGDDADHAEWYCRVDPLPHIDLDAPFTPKW